MLTLLESKESNAMQSISGFNVEFLIPASPRVFIDWLHDFLRWRAVMDNGEVRFKATNIKQDHHDQTVFRIMGSVAQDQDISTFASSKNVFSGWLHDFPVWRAATSDGESHFKKQGPWEQVARGSLLPLDDAQTRTTVRVTCYRDDLKQFWNFMLETISEDWPESRVSELNELTQAENV